MKIISVVSEIILQLKKWLKRDQEEIYENRYRII